jgi:phosphoribosylaminoimidazolecarboxamide formyltransferase/IMP cyclohydrolase
MLKRKGDKCRFLVNPALGNLSKDSIDNHRRFRYVRGGFLSQPNYNFILDFNHPSPALPLKGREGAVIPPPAGGRLGGGAVEGIGKTSDQQKSDLLLAWAVGSTSNSNTVTIVKDGMLLGNGVGQQDRVGCCQLAIKRATDAGHQTKGAVAYSDSFFPFVDGVETLSQAGISAIFATSGSVRDGEVKDFCKEKNIALYLVPDSEARGFFGH